MPDFDARFRCDCSNLLAIVLPAQIGTKPEPIMLLMQSRCIFQAEMGKMPQFRPLVGHLAPSTPRQRLPGTVFKLVRHFV